MTPASTRRCQSRIQPQPTPGSPARSSRPRTSTGPSPASRTRSSSATRAPTTSSCSASRPAASPLARRLAARIDAVRGPRRSRSARSTSRMYRDDLRLRAGPRAGAHRDPGRRRRRHGSSSSSTTCCSPAARSGPRSTRSATSAARARSSWPSWSTAATASCRSAPTTSARTCPTSLRETVRVLLAEIDGATTCVVLGSSDRGTRREAAPAVGGRPRAATTRCWSSTPPTEMAALAGREVKKLPTLRGRTVVNLFFEDSTRTRISFEVAGQAAVAPTSSTSPPRARSVSKGEILKDTALTLEAMGADAVVIRHRVQRRAAPARALRLDRRQRRQRRRRHPRAPHPGAARRVHDARASSARLDGPARRRSSATSCTAGWPAPTCCCCARWAPRSPWSRRRRCCRSASTRGRARCRYDLDARAAQAPTSVMMLRVQRERMNGGVLPDRPRVHAAATASTRGRAATAARPRDRHAPRPDEPRHGDRRRGRRRPALARSSSRSPTASACGWPCSTSCSAARRREDGWPSAERSLSSYADARRRGRSAATPADLLLARRRHRRDRAPGSTRAPAPRSSTPTAWSRCPAWSTCTPTCASRAARTPRPSRPARGPPRSAASPPCSRWPTPTRSPTPPASSSRSGGSAARPGCVRRAAGRRRHRRPGGRAARRARRDGRLRRRGCGSSPTTARACHDARADAPRAGVRQGVRRRRRPARRRSRGSPRARR